MTITNNFEKLEAWREAHRLVIQIYKITKKFPPEEKFRLIDQCNIVGRPLGGLVNYLKSKSPKSYILNL